jgi:hypothetical protein
MKFQRVISLIDWPLFDNIDDPDFAMNVFHDVLFYVFDSCFPYVTVRFTNKDPPWMSVSLKVLLNRRDRAFSKGKMRQFQLLRSQVIHLTAQLKKEYLKKMEQASSKRDAWRGIRLISRNRKTFSSLTGFSAEKLNEYFASVFQSDLAHLHTNDDLSSLPQHPLIVTVDLVHSYLCNLKKGNGGPSGLPFWVFKDNSVFLSFPIASIFNKCFLNGRVPSVLKFANVIPVPKLNKPTEACHFRPISILPVLSKVMERVVLHK